MSIEARYDDVGGGAGRSNVVLHPSGRRSMAVDRFREVVEIDIVLPAFNEEARIGPTVTAISEYAQKSSRAIRLIVVDNGSVDGTCDAIEAAKSAGTPVEIISCQWRGKGAAVRTGVLHSIAPCVGFCDADLSTPPAAIGQGLDLLNAGWDVVVGSRRCLGASYLVPQSTVRRLGSLVFRSLTAHLVGPISDTQCGFKLFRTEVARSVFDGSALDGFAFDVEILRRVLEGSYRVIELPVQWSDQGDSSFRLLSDGLDVLRSLNTLRNQRRLAR
jgi:dolichyl-phosphate beta-glucosyltransferase